MKGGRKRGKRERDEGRKVLIVECISFRTAALYFTPHFIASFPDAFKAFTVK
jgi:hypothetical protein